MLTARNLHKGFADHGPIQHIVIDDLSLDLNPGEIICLLGASGCGKTTLLRILAGLDKPDRGEIKSTVKRPGPELGYYAQSDQLLPWRSIVDNIALGPELCGTPKKQAHDAALHLLQQVGLYGFAHHYPAQLSGGMKQRVLLARLLALSPQLLLLDEPMSALDVSARRDLAGLVKTYIDDTQASAVLVTHSVEEACFLADRIFVLTRRPARIFHEITIAEEGAANANMGTIPRSESLNIAMASLVAALEGEHAAV